MSVPVDESRVALITGAGSGIGRATALALADTGFRIAIADRDMTGAETTRAMITERGGTAATFEVDVLDEASVAAMVAGVISTFGRLDAAVNNAGIGGPRKLLHELGAEDWDLVTGINLRGTFLCMKYEVPHMLERGDASIVNIASELGVVGSASMSAYVASKHGVVGLSRAAALDYGGKIRVNAVCPGAVHTPMVVDLGYDTVAMAANYPIGRLGQPEEIASAVVWLCSPGASFATGGTFVIDGGSSIT